MNVFIEMFLISNEKLGQNKFGPKSCLEHNIFLLEMFLDLKYFEPEMFF